MVQPFLASCMLFSIASAAFTQENTESTTAGSKAKVGNQQLAGTDSEKIPESRIPIQVERHLVFREFKDGTSLKADLFRPTAEAPPDGFPLVLMIHGGAWSGGDKWDLLDHGRELAQAGFVAVAINYRLAPKVKIGKQLEDCNAAARWAISQAKEWKANPDRFGLWGYSAGAHLASLLALRTSRNAVTKELSQDTLKTEARTSVRAVVAGGIPADFSFVPEKSPFLAHVFGGSRFKLPKIYEEFSPLAQVHGKAPPFFLFHGDSDFLVPYKLSLKMSDALNDAGVSCKHMKIANKGHMLTFLDRSARRAAIGFLRANLTQRVPIDPSKDP
ncbi:MAG: alpha/beta hydrolase fold domain-containing protein [Pirellulaceae bacterium]